MIQCLNGYHTINLITLMKEVKMIWLYCIHYSATWKDGPLYYNFSNKKWIRKSDEKVTLKCLHNSQSTNDFNDEFLKSLVL